MSDDESADYLQPPTSRPRLFLCFLLAATTLVAFVLLRPRTPPPSANQAGPAVPPSRQNQTWNHLRSKVLGEDCQFVVYLPCGYDASQSYPVLVLLDDQRHADYLTGIAHYLAHGSGKIPSVIIVEILQRHRNRDMSPAPEKDRPYESGGADKFLEFLAKELVPHIRSKYRTHPPLVLQGHSLAGLFVLHTLVTKPDLFDGYIASSPAVWRDTSGLVARTDEFFKSHKELKGKLFLGIGAEDRQEVQDYFSQMSRIFAESTPKGFEVSLRRFEEEGLSTTCIPTTYYGLRFVLDTNATVPAAKP